MVFITGTGTDVGKTFVATWLCTHLRWPYWKPIQTGVRTASEKDSIFVSRYARVPILQEQYCFYAPQAPERAAEEENKTIQFTALNKPIIDPVIIEGAGGVYVPITHDHTMLDLMRKWNVGVIVVASTALGTINHTVLTVKAVQQGGISVIGVILSGTYDEYNKVTIERLGGIPVLATLPLLSNDALQDTLCFSRIPLPEQLQKVLLQ